MPVKPGTKLRSGEPPRRRRMASRAYVSWFGFKGGDQQKKVAYMLGQ